VAGCDVCVCVCVCLGRAIVIGNITQYSDEISVADVRMRTFSFCNCCGLVSLSGELLERISQKYCGTGIGTAST